MAPGSTHGEANSTRSRMIECPVVSTNLVPFPSREMWGRDASTGGVSDGESGAFDPRVPVTTEPTVCKAELLVILPAKQARAMFHPPA